MIDFQSQVGSYRTDVFLIYVSINFFYAGKIFSTLICLIITCCTQGFDKLFERGEVLKIIIGPKYQNSKSEKNKKSF